MTLQPSIGFTLSCHRSSDNRSSWASPKFPCCFCFPLGEALQQALCLLTPRERTVITLRYGIGDGQSRTLVEVGNLLGISRERVRQLEVVALTKLREMSKHATLKDYA